MRGSFGSPRYDSRKETIMKMRDRMTRANPVLGALVERMDALISGHNELVKVVFVGKNPHSENDATNVMTAPAASGTSLDPVIDISHDLRTQYEAHRADTGVHAAADNTNSVTAVSVAAKVKALADDLKAQLNAHLSDAAHTDPDDVTTPVAAPAMTTKASGITLINQIRAAYEAHRQQEDDSAGTGTVHAGADAANEVTVDALGTGATWAEMAELADDLRTQYEAHRVVTPAVHVGADTTNDMNEAAVGNVQTVTNTLLNEEKADFNAHIVYDDSHYTVDRSMVVTAANATTLATSRTLANQLRENYADHISRAPQLTAAPLVDTLDED